MPTSEVSGHEKIQVKFSRFSWNFYYRSELDWPKCRKGLKSKLVQTWPK